jgi:hypothetical protein
MGFPRLLYANLFRKPRSVRGLIYCLECGVLQCEKTGSVEIGGGDYYHNKG